MRVVFVPIPGLGHAFPLVPTAWGFAAAGHEVVMVAANEAVAVKEAGLHVVNPMPDASMAAGMEAFHEDAPDMFSDMASWSVEQILAMKPMVVQPWDRYIDAHVDAVVALQPDLILFDPMFAAGPIAAAKLGIPAVAQASNLVRFTPEFLLESAQEAFDRHNVGLPQRYGLIDVGPTTLLEPGPSDWQMRCVSFNGGADLPQWLTTPGDRPRVTVTLGTTMPRVAGTDRLRQIIQAAEGIDAEFAVTVGTQSADQLGPLPDNVRVTGWVPLSRLAAHSSAIIHHGGSGTTLAAVAAGIPHLVLPAGADTDYNARALSALGAGLLIRGDVDDVSLKQLITDDSLSASAKLLKAENQQLQSPAQVVDHLVDFVQNSH